MSDNETMLPTTSAEPIAGIGATTAALNKVRKIEDVEREYGQLCSQAGQKQYQIEVLKAELGSINQLLLNLNKEHSEIKSRHIVTI